MYCRIEEEQGSNVFPPERGGKSIFDETSCVVIVKLGLPQSEVRVACCCLSHGLGSKSHVLWPFVKCIYIWPTQIHKHGIQNGSHPCGALQKKISLFFFFNELSVWYTPPGGNEPSELKLAHPLNLKDYFWWLRLRLRLFVF